MTQALGHQRRADLAVPRSQVARVAHYALDFSSKDMTALPAEQWAALAVYRPAGFTKVTLTA
jgi:hypothetical protein